MMIDWDPEIDTPATIAVIGGGPTGVEAALYARFLGYSVILFDAGKVGDSLLSWGDRPVISGSKPSGSKPSDSSSTATWGEITTSLGLAALEAQSGPDDLPARDASVTYRQYVEKYLLPVARTDLLYDSMQIHSPVRSISRVSCSAQDSEPIARRAEQEFRVLVDSSKRGEYSQLVDVILDCSELGPRRRGLATGGGPAIGESQFTQQILIGKRDVLGKERQRFAGKHTLLFGSDLSACANAMEWMPLIESSQDTRLTWIIPKRLGQGGKVKLDATVDTYGPILEAAQAVLESENRNLVSMACWGIEAIHRSDTNWSIKLQSTEEETLEVAVDEFINCSDAIADRRYAEHLLLAAGEGAGERDRQVAGLATGEPHYYILGPQVAGIQELADFAQIQSQIREVFSMIGGRKDLDLYATVKPQH